jgi:hypothetical protein
MVRAFPLRPRICLLTGLLVAACGGGAGASNQIGDAVTTPLSVEDIARWESGMAAELAAVRKSGARLETASTGEDTLSALMGVQEMTTTPAGAEAAGLDQERYQAVRSGLEAAVGYLTPHMGGIDTTILSPAQRDEMRRVNPGQLKQLEGTVPAGVIEALKPRAETLRKKELELAGARLKGAGM